MDDCSAHTRREHAAEDWGGSFPGPGAVRCGLELRCARAPARHEGRHPRLAGTRLTLILSTCSGSPPVKPLPKFTSDIAPHVGAVGTSIPNNACEWSRANFSLDAVGYVVSRVAGTKGRACGCRGRVTGRRPKWAQLLWRQRSPGAICTWKRAVATLPTGPATRRPGRRSCRSSSPLAVTLDGGGQGAACFGTCSMVLVLVEFRVWESPPEP